MIVRLLSFVLLLYLLGFLLFAVSLGDPAGDEKTDAAIAITGGSGRIEQAMDVLADKQAKRVFISGADPSVSKKDLAVRLGRRGKQLQCCVDLGSESVDTRSNAEEAKRWLDKNRYKSVRLITSDWHMRRARYEFRRVLGSDYELVYDAVRSQPSFTLLFGEYNKYVLRRAAVLLEL